MSQLIQVMTLTYLITEPPKDTCSTGKTTEETVAGEKGAKDNNIVDDWEEKDVLLSSWISGTLTEESIYLIVGCSTAKEMWECLEESYLQATKDKEFQLKQQLQSVKLRTKTIDEYIKEFKGICDGLAAIHKPVDEDSKVINFARGLGLKYKTFRTVMLGKAPYPTLNQFVNALNQFVNALRGFDMREDEKEVPQQNHNMAFFAQSGRGRGNYSQRRGNNNFNSRERGFKPAGQGTCSYNSRNGPSPQNSSSSGSHERNNTDACQICGRNNHTALKCFYRWDYSYQAADELSQALTATNLQNTTDDTLYVDSAASSHMTHNSGILTDLKHYNGTDKIIIGNGSKLAITHVGNISRSGLKLKEVLVVPKINKNLLSVSKLAKDNCCTLEFDETNFVVKEKKTRTLLANGTKRNGLYALKDNNLYALTAARDWNTTDNMWHTRLGHPSLKSLKKMVEKQFSKEIKIFQCDGGGEFIQTDFIKHLEDCGIVRHISCPNTPEQNGVAQRKHRHIVETGLTLLLHANLPLFLWVEAFLTAVFLINRLTSSVLKMVTPFVKLYGEQPDYNSLKAHDKFDLWEVHAASPHITSDNAATTHILLDGESTIDLSGAGSDAEEHVEGPANEHHQTTTLVDVPVDHQSDNATLQSTTLVDILVEVLPAPQGHHMITRHKAKE
ncbi:hypothetical protein KY285_003781 [Solanum tuberosum]|nr:hypothetical protein KY285_003781 [Solanum tuberosum]